MSRDQVGIESVARDSVAERAARFMASYVEYVPEQDSTEQDSSTDEQVTA